MSQRGVVGGPKVKRVMTQAINLIFEFLKNRERIQIWLYENVAIKMEGVIIGFDEYMNVVLDEAVEVNVKTSSRKQIGRILLKGDCITLIQRADPSSGESL
eukprot:gene11947-13857_t